ncbi:hypothetical protein H0H93_010326, partial [Arthromyces matolae]
LWTACESVYFGRRQGVLAPYTEEETLKHLTLATTILPQVAVIRVSADSHYPNDRIPTRALSPLLPQVSELAWHIDHPAAHLESLSGLAPSSLSLLKTLSITLQESDIIHAKTLRAKLFGDSPNLRDLHVICQYPVLLYPDFTWVHLQSLSLSTTNRPASSLIKNSWLELVDPKPMVSLPALKKLTLRSQSDICSIILRLNFPWKQLTSIDIYWSDHPHGIPALLEPLSQCESLVSLRIENYGDPPSDTIYDDDNLITLPSLRYLNVWTAVPIFMVKSLASSGTIHALDAGALPLADFYIIIAQCPNLKILQCQIEVDKRTPIKKDTIILHHLTSLTLFFEEDYEWSAFSFPTLLAAPMLSFLKVRVQAQVGTFPLDMTAHLITRSEARLSHLNLTMNMTHAIEDQLAGSLLAILSTLENCDSVHLVGLAPPQSVLDLIASRRLLPHVTSLTFSALSDDDLLSTMEGRLRCERESGHTRVYVKSDRDITSTAAVKVFWYASDMFTVYVG